jgi:hypothetical protein
MKKTVKEESNAPAIKSALLYCMAHKTIGSNETLPSPDLQKIEDLKKRDTTLSYTEFEELSRYRGLGRTENTLLEALHGKVV